MKSWLADLLAVLGAVLIVVCVAAKFGGWWAMGVAGAFCLLGASQVAVAEAPATPKVADR